MFKDLENIEIERLVYGGDGLARREGRVVFVPFSIPGETLDIHLQKEKSKYACGVIKSILSASVLRTAPLCRHFGRCGGCHWQHITYDGQLAFKFDVFSETLARLSSGLTGQVLPILPSPAPYGYRSRIKVHVKSNHIGFFARESHNLIRIDQCPLALPSINALLTEISSHLPGKLKGETGEIELIGTEDSAMAVFYGSGKGKIEDGRALLGSSLESLFLKDRADTSQKSISYSFQTYAGKFTYFLPPGVFSQINLAQNTNLINEVISWSGISETDQILDLYCGMGNFTLPLAARAERVIGVEMNEAGIDAAKVNAAMNHIENVIFVNQPVLSAVDHYIRKKTSFQLIVLDPPRAGCHEIIPKLKLLNCSKLLYVSCDPATLARDIRTLSLNGFTHVRSKPVDMFPQTYHIESLSLFTR